MKTINKILGKISRNFYIQNQLEENRKLGIQKTLKKIDEIENDLEMFEGKKTEGLYHLSYREYQRKINFAEFLGADLSNRRFYPVSIEMETQK